LPACTACTRVSTTCAPSPVAFRFGLVQPGRFQPQPKASAPDRRRQPTSATVKEHEHTDAAARTSLQNPLFRRILLLRCETGHASGTTSGADAPCARGQGRDRPAGLRVSMRDRSHRGPLAASAKHLVVVCRPLPRVLVVPLQRTANRGRNRSAARTVRTFIRPRCFRSPGTLAGAEPRDCRSRATRYFEAACPRDPRLLRHPCRLASTGGPTKSNGGEQRLRLAGHQPEPCRTAAPRMISA
jgi:hypothetical protein